MEELIAIHQELKSRADGFKMSYGDQMSHLMNSALDMQRSWCGSNLGYHACVYYEDLVPRPPGANFSAEWGLTDMKFAGLGTTGDWVEFDREYVKSEVRNRAGNPDLRQAKSDSEDLSQLANECKGHVLSALTVATDANPDEFLARLIEEAERVEVRDQFTLSRALLPDGKLMSRDSTAVTQGLQLAPHQEIIVELAALRAASDVASDLADIARRAVAHMDRKGRSGGRSSQVGTKIFIGHGRSALWRELKDFVVDRLCLSYEEFNRVPVAGVTNIARLEDMLDSASCALIVLTAEDEQADGSTHARMNVVHEVGLFQGRLGFTKAIVILEEGCTEFSNIQGLGQIRFPRGNIAAAFEEVRAVLERENIVMA